MQTNCSGKAFTLIELLIVIAIMALLVSILLPSLAKAKLLAKITKVHAELRSITMAMDLYREDNDQKIPPTRFSCSTRTEFDLPVELFGYLPRNQKNGEDVVGMPDPFDKDSFYKYRAVGPAIINESTILEDASGLWVPDDFPYETGTTGQYYYDPKTSPVRYAVYSMGPEPNSPKFDIPGRLPVPRAYWLTNASGSGVIVHLEDSNRQIIMSP